MENKKKIFKKVRPFIGLIFFISAIVISTLIVFFSVASILIYPLLWVIFTALTFFKPQKQGFVYCLKSIRLAMWVYFCTIFMLLLWTPTWLKKWSTYLEGKTWWNVFKDGSDMCGITSIAFILSVLVLTGFTIYYKWRKKRHNDTKLREDNQNFLEN